MIKKTAVKKRRVLDVQKIPPPPGREVSWEEKAAYYEKYDWDDLERAGYLRPLTKKEEAEQAQLERAIRNRKAVRHRKVS